MAQQVIGIGAAPDDGTGDPLRTAYDKCNDNFSELYGKNGALVLHAPTPVTHTGSTAETTIATVTIPGGAMGPRGKLRITPLWVYTNNANNKTLRVKAGGSAVQVNVPTTTGTLQIVNVLHNQNAENAQIQFANTTSTGTGTAGSQSTHSINTAADFDVTFTAQLADAADSVTLVGAVIEVFYAA